jgi:hypothetical protein
MILYDLTCPSEHRFESWFRNSGAVEKLVKAGQVQCPECGSTKVQKAPMAPRLAKSSPTEIAVADRKGEVLEAMKKAEQAITQLREVIHKNFEYVGEKFPEEARKMHYGETKKRGIHGEASVEDAKSLVDEGIEVGMLPGPRRTDA